MEDKDQHGMLRNVIWYGWNVEYKGEPQEMRLERKSGPYREDL